MNSSWERLCVGPRLRVRGSFADVAPDSLLSIFHCSKFTLIAGLPKCAFRRAHSLRVCAGDGCVQVHAFKVDQLTLCWPLSPRLVGWWVRCSFLKMFASLSIRLQSKICRVAGRHRGVSVRGQHNLLKKLRPSALRTPHPNLQIQAKIKIKLKFKCVFLAKSAAWRSRVQLRRRVPPITRTHTHVSRRWVAHHVHGMIAMHSTSVSTREEWLRSIKARRALRRSYSHHAYHEFVKFQTEI